MELKFAELGGGSDNNRLGITIGTKKRLTVLAFTPAQMPFPGQIN